MKGIALHSVIPVRVNPAEEAEQETQMIFGEMCEVISPTPNPSPEGRGGTTDCKPNKWTYIRLDDDGEEGWVDTKMLTILSEQEEKEYLSAIGGLTGEAGPIAQRSFSAAVKYPMAYAVSENNGQTIPLTAGTRLPNYKDGQFSILGVSFRIDPQMVAEQPMAMTEENVLNTVRFFINTPYLWGGKNALGIDCSGFSQTIYSLFGIRLNRMARQQILQGKEVASLEEAQCGDLAFFDHADERSASAGKKRQTYPIIHVGILLDKERIIHASGRVKIEKIDNQGIYSAELGRYTHHLAGIRRYER